MPYKTPISLRKIAYATQQGRCCYCGRPMWIDDVATFATKYHYSPNQARLLKCTAEHLKARTDGGGNSESNIAAACLYCNRKRHQRKYPLLPEQYRHYVQKKLAQGGWHRIP